jgi:hypothetical protein
MVLALSSTALVRSSHPFLVNTLNRRQSGPLLMALHPDPYVVLGVDRSASAATIKQAYRRLAMQSHPDTSTAPDAESTFRSVVEAYVALTERKPYGSAARSRQSASASRGSSSSVVDEDAWRRWEEEFGDPLDGLDQSLGRRANGRTAETADAYRSRANTRTADEFDAAQRLYNEGRGFKGGSLDPIIEEGEQFLALLLAGAMAFLIAFFAILFKLGEGDGLHLDLFDLFR